ncbi:MAG: NTP transferase domain-containing protein [Hespellia sp.]|jgi:molybdenum cofactor cytidylyltransferase|nr:NTP transferase domain-containing protein [Hespellia sp.]
MRMGAVISAAEKSLRREYYEQNMTSDEPTMAERAVVNFQRAGVRDIVVVTGDRTGELERALRKYGVIFLRNNRYESGQMLDSARIGLRYLQERCDSIFFCPADLPFFSMKTVRKMWEAWEKERSVVIPSCGGKAGHPVLIPTSLVPFILDYQGERGLKGALDSSGVEPVYVTVEDKGAILKSKSEEELKELVRLHDAAWMRPHVKVRLINRHPCFGPGTVTLLRQIDSLGSVREACEKTGISYSKGWSMIHAAEEGLNASIVERRKGGRFGGTASVTETGKVMMRLYEQFEREVQELAEKRFQEIFLESDCFLKNNRQEEG